MSISEIISLVFPSLLELLKAPFQEPSLLWQLIPIWMLWIVMLTYFGTHKHEQLGWNSALANGVSLFWIIISGMQHIFSAEQANFTWVKFVLIGIIALYSIFIIWISFSHRFSKKITFSISSPSSIYFFSIVVLLFAYDVIALTSQMIVAIILLFIVILFLGFLYKKILPESKKDSEDSEDDPFSSSSSSSDFSSQNSLDSSSFDTSDFANSSSAPSQTSQSNPQNPNDQSFNTTKF